MNLPAEIQARRKVEDRAAELGDERSALAKKASANAKEIKELMPVALDAGVTMEMLSKLTRVSRQTLHQWRQESADGEAASQRKAR